MPEPMPRSLLTRILAAVVAVIVAIVSLTVGAVVFLALFGLGILAFLALQVRLWWQRRGRASARRQAGDGERSRGRVIEGEYRRGPSDDGS